MHSTLRPYQIDGVLALERMGGRGILADEQGLGKTPQALCWIERNVPPGRTAVVTCPAAVKYNWDDEAWTHCRIRPDVAESLKPPKNGLCKPRLLVINHDILYAWLPYLRSLKPFAVINDESQNFRNAKARWTQAAIQLVKGVPHVIHLTGTPMFNRPSDLWPMLHMIDPVKWKHHFVFCHRFGGPKKTPWGWKFDGASHVAELRAELEKVMLRRKKEDVLKDLPDKLHNAVGLRLKAADVKDYRLAERDLVQWLKLHKQDTDVRAQALQRLNLLKVLVAKAKVGPVCDWVENFLDSGEKLVLFCTHRAFVATVAGRFPGCAVVNGDVTGVCRQKEYRRFNEDPKCRLFVGNIKAAGVGWSAKGCSNVAIAELPWSPADLSQCIDRCHGLGRGQEGVPTTAWYLTAAGTVEENVCRKLRDKAKVINRVIDGVDTDGEELDVLNSIIAGLLTQSS